MLFYGIFTKGLQTYLQFCCPYPIFLIVCFYLSILKSDPHMISTLIPSYTLLTFETTRMHINAENRNIHFAVDVCSFISNLFIHMMEALNPT